MSIGSIARLLCGQVIDFIKRKPDGLALGMNFDIFNAIRYCNKNIISAKSSINCLQTNKCMI